MIQISYKLTCATATQAGIGPSHHKSAQIKAYSAYHRLHNARVLTEILPRTRNSAAQPGRSQPRRREAFLPLARSERMKALPKQISTVVVTDKALS
jgi:hypothetical protein